MGLKLETALADIKGIPPRFLKNLANLKIFTVQDLLWHFPVRYEDFSEISRIAELEPGQQAVIQGVVQNIKLRRSFRRRMTIVEAMIRDDSGDIKAVWFNQPYLLNTLRPGRAANFAGKVASNDDEIYLSHPTYELIKTRVNADTTRINADIDVDERGYIRENPRKNPRESTFKHTGRLVPIYPETRGLTSKGIRFLVQLVLKNLEPLEEWLPEEILETTGFPEINRALASIHFPETIDSTLAAKRRFSFEELFLLQLFNIQQKLELAQEKAPPIKTDLEKLKKILKDLPFELTTSQKKSLWEIIQDLEKPRPMNRLLQGDVGSGKTIVAALAAIIADQNDWQTSFMAPTEILAQQHFETLKKLFREIKSASQPVLGILTSSGAEMIYENDLAGKISKSEFKKKTAAGEIKIIIGTHALIQKDVGFHNLGLVIVDEQHRFGVKQRAALLHGQTLTDKKSLTYADNEKEQTLLYEDITYKIHGCVFKVRKEVGVGHKEIVYQKALSEAFRLAGLEFEEGRPLDIYFQNKKVGTYKPDFIVKKIILVELKALPFIGATEKRQLWTYAKGTQYKIALLINFGPQGAEIERIIYDAARGLRKSALAATSPRKSAALIPHFLSMSATPIPRTLMLTVFGDLDISTITELPAGRKPVVTKIVAPENREKAYAFIRGQIKKGRQAFVICPRIEAKDREDIREVSRKDSHAFALLEVKAVKEEYEKLSKKIFPDLKVAMLHGRLKSKEKESVMKRFKNRHFDILVSTSVVEVGVDVPNAAIMLIEGSERFGLAQLYQLRGRVGRGQHQSFCFLFTDSNSRTTQERLKAIVNAKNGFDLAEMDLKLRGPGEFVGQKQTGLPDIAMRGLQDIELIKQSRRAALLIVQKDREFKKCPLLREKLNEFQRKIHLE